MRSELVILGEVLGYSVVCWEVGSGEEGRGRVVFWERFFVFLDVGDGVCLGMVVIKEFR